MLTVVPHLWFPENAAEAAAFYVSLFPESKVNSVTTLPADSPSGPIGSVEIVDFILAGQPVQAITAGPLDPFNHSFSFVVACTEQDEIDRLWEALSEGGSIEQCGWLKDRFGLSWQITAAVIGDMLKDPDAMRAGRAAQAMLRMIKIDIAELTKAFNGD